jgi:2-keto-4-pentenoate hydratase/2-oxohepta-3-ene-1,7-dioic acid hydratase in catechol pathway
MKLVSYEGGFGRVEGDRIVPMGEDLVDFLRAGVSKDAETLPLSSVTLTAPVPAPGKIICIGLNYRKHVAEVEAAVPLEPVLFAKFSNCVAGPDQTIFVPEIAADLDYEAELGVVIGRTAREVARRAALDHVAGYLCVNDLSSRALQFRTSQWTTGKTVDGFCPMGPWLVTADEIGDPQQLAIRCEVDGEVRQSASTADMIFGVAELVEAISRTITLEPGDVIATGTPSGVAMGMTPPRYLRPGNEVVVEIERVGRLANRIEARPPADTLSSPAP